jgi:hypothetical protein
MCRVRLRWQPDRGSGQAGQMSSQWAVSSGGPRRCSQQADAGRRPLRAVGGEGDLTLGCVRSEVLASPSRTGGPVQHRGGTWPALYPRGGRITARAGNAKVYDPAALSRTACYIAMNGPLGRPLAAAVARERASAQLVIMIDTRVVHPRTPRGSWSRREAAHHLRAPANLAERAFEQVR